MEEKKSDEYWFVVKIVYIGVILIIPYYILYISYKLCRNAIVSIFDLKTNQKVYPI